MDVKEPKSFDEQLNILKERGCIIGDENYAIRVLQHINYYRLSAYLLPYKRNDGKYASGTTFNTIHRIYEFDRKLRNLLFIIIEEIELTLRTQLAYHHAHRYGALGYMNKGNYNNKHNHQRLLEHVSRAIDKNKNQPFVSHHIEKYDGNFPIWVIIELFTLNDLSIFYSDMQIADQKAIALDSYGSTYRVLSTWLHCLTILRNYCAHYSRLYYATFPIKPLTPLGFSYELSQQIFDYILVLRFLYPYPERWIAVFVSPLQALLEEYNDCVKLKYLGFPNDWYKILEEPVPRRKAAIEKSSTTHK